MGIDSFRGCATADRRGEYLQNGSRNCQTPMSNYTGWWGGYDHQMLAMKDSLLPDLQDYVKAGMCDLSCFSFHPDDIHSTLCNRVGQLSGYYCPFHGFCFRSTVIV